MAKKYCLTLDKEFLEFVELNEIEDPKEFLIECYKKGFQLEKYGETPGMIEARNSTQLKSENETLRNEVDELQKTIRTLTIQKKEVKQESVMAEPTPTPLPTETPEPRKIEIKKDEDLYDE